MSAEWPHIPEDLHVGDVFIARATAHRGKQVVRRKRRSDADGGFWVKIDSQSGDKLYYFGEQIRIVRKET